VIVDGAVLRHQRVDIGDGDQQPHPPVLLDTDLELVEIAGLVVVDRGPRQVAQVTQA
jgi:hypothetical protein